MTTTEERNLLTGYISAYSLREPKKKDGSFWGFFWKYSTGEITDSFPVIKRV